MVWFCLWERNRHLEVKDVAGGGLNPILDMDVAVTCGVKIETQHVVHLEENSCTPFTPLHTLQKGMHNI